MQEIHRGLLSHYHHCLTLETQNPSYGMNCKKFDAHKNISSLNTCLLIFYFLQLFSHLQMNYSKTFQRSNVDFLETPELITTMLVPGKHHFFHKVLFVACEEFCCISVFLIWVHCIIPPFSQFCFCVEEEGTPNGFILSKKTNKHKMHQQK